MPTLLHPALALPNLPTIISKIAGIFSSRKSQKGSQEDIGFIKNMLEAYDKDVDSILEHVIALKNTGSMNVKKVDDLIAELKFFNVKRREENIAIIDTMESMLNSITSIKNVMKNVMSEEDSVRLISYLLGILKGFSSSLLKRVMDAIESFDSISDEELNEEMLMSEMDNCWSDIKAELSRFNTPIKLRPILDSYDEKFWSSNGLFKKIVKISKEKKNVKVMSVSIKRIIEISLREMFDDISKSLDGHRKNNEA